MTRFYRVAPDAHGDATIWSVDRDALTNGRPGDPVAVLRECDLPPAARVLWLHIVTAVTLLETCPDCGDVCTPEEFDLHAGGMCPA